MRLAFRETPLTTHLSILRRLPCPRTAPLAVLRPHKKKSVLRPAEKKTALRSRINLKKPFRSLCFHFADGRHCRTPRRSGHPHLCAFHAQKEAQSQASKQAAEDISSFFFGNYLSACDFSAALGRVFSAVAQGQLKPKAATALAYLGQTLNQSVKIAQDEYANVFGGAVWRRKVASCFEPPPPAPVPKRASQPARPAHPPHRTRTSTLVTLIQLRRGRRDFTPTPVGEAGRCSGL